MIKGARVIIIDGKKILLIHRLKYGKEYFVLPGGAIEKDENPAEAAIRELEEETGLSVEIKPFCKIIEKVEEEKRLVYFFLAKNFSGKLKLGGPEAEIQSKDNVYSLEWVPLEKVKNLLLYPKEIKEKLIRKF